MSWVFPGATETQKFCRNWVVTGTRRKGGDLIVGQMWVLAPAWGFLQNSKLLTPWIASREWENVEFLTRHLPQSWRSVPINRWTSARNSLWLMAIRKRRQKVQLSKDVSSEDIQSLEWHHLSSVSYGGWISRLATTPTQERPRTIHPPAPACYVDWWDRWHHLKEWHLLSVNITSKLFIYSRKKKACRKYRVSVAN